MRAVPIFALLTALCAPAALAGQTSQPAAPGNSWDENWTKCEGSDPAGRIAGCTALILANKESPKGLATAYMNRGTAYSVGGNYERAIENYDPAIRLDPTNANAFYNRGYAYEAEGDDDRAIQDFSQALHLNSDDTTALTARGGAYEEKGDYDLAIQDFNQALHLNNDDTAALAGRGAANAAKGDFAHALLDLNRATELDPKGPGALAVRGYVYAQEKQNDLAIQDYSQALLESPNNARVLSSRGQTYLFMGQVGAALNDLDAGVKLEPSFAYSPLWLFLARQRAGQDGRDELERNATQVKLAEWPGPAINLFLGRTTPEGFLAAANSSDLQKNKEQHCAAYFYLAEYALTKGNVAEAKRLFQQVIDTGMTGLVEYVDAQAELTRMPAAGTEVAEVKRGLVEEPVAPVAAMQNGKYYALVIGINQYKAPLPQLKTAVGDARAIAAVLHDRYGFEVKLLLDGDATRVNILEAITQYRSRLNENDSLLIYYAGHGYSDHDADKAYWLPVDADSPFSPNRIIADDLTTDVRAEPARHVLIISDSCYSGGLSRDADIIQGSNGQAAFLRKMENSRSRTLMASGGDEPVSDAGTDGHSVFAYAVLKALEGEEGAMFTASDLFYNSVRQQVAGKSEQVPQYSIIRNSNHDEGDFVFVRKGP